MEKKGIKNLDYFYFKIGTCTIKITLLHTDLTYAKEVHIEQVFSAFKGFISYKTDREIDFTLFFSHLESNVAMKEKNKIFSLILQFNGKSEAYTTYQISIFEFHLIIKAILLKLLVKKKMLLLHASAVGNSNKAYVFLGKPGAGKSTSMKLLGNKFTPLADDSVIISEENGKFYIYQTPFFEKESWIKKKNKKYPLTGIFFLKKSKDFKIVKEQRNEVIAERIITQAISNNKVDKKYMELIYKFITNYDNFNYLYFAKQREKLEKVFEDLERGSFK